MKQCKDCKFLRTNVKVFSDAAVLPKKYGDFVSPCNRYPQNTGRGPLEPACGEFKKRED